MGTDQTLSREKIVKTIVEALEPLDYVYALWEGGAIAFDRLDEWSDIDICIDAKDERVNDAFPVVERALESLAPIELKYEMLKPALGEYVQAFYRLGGTSRFMLIDFAVFKHSAKDKLLEPEIHGNSRFHFNKGDAVECPPLDREALITKLKARVERIQKRLDTFGCFIPKEMYRENYIEALDLYYKLMLDSLVEILRIRYKPVHHDFRTRYVHYDLPADVVTRLRQLYFVKDEHDLKTKCDLAEAWLTEAVHELDFDAIDESLKRP